MRDKVFGLLSLLNTSFTRLFIRIRLEPKQKNNSFYYPEPKQCTECLADLPPLTLSKSYCKCHHVQAAVMLPR